MKFLSTAALLKSPVCLTIEVTPSKETRISLASVNWPTNQIPRISCLVALNFYKTFAFPFLGVPVSCKANTHSYNKYVFPVLCAFFRLSLQQVTRKALFGSNQHNEWTFSKKTAVLADLWKAKLAITWADASFLLQLSQNGHGGKCPVARGEGSCLHQPKVTRRIRQITDCVISHMVNEMCSVA